MSKENYLNKIKDLPETVKQFGGLVLIVLIIFFSFYVSSKVFMCGSDQPTSPRYKAALALAAFMPMHILLLFFLIFQKLRAFTKQ